jgi:hypothetical protein
MNIPTQESIDHLIIVAHRKGYKWGWVVGRSIDGEPEHVPRSEWKRGKKGEKNIPWEAFFEYEFSRCPVEMEARTVAAWMAKQIPKLNNFLFAHFEKNPNILLRAVSKWPEKPLGNYKGVSDSGYSKLKQDTKKNNAKMQATKLTIKSVTPVTRGEQWCTAKAVRSKRGRK